MTISDLLPLALACLWCGAWGYLCIRWALRARSAARDTDKAADRIVEAMQRDPAQARQDAARRVR